MDINYEKSFALGDKTEKHFATLLLDKGWTDITITGGMFSEYDISAIKDFREVKFEIKSSSAVLEYKHHFVEYYQSDLPSGMQLTTADWQVYYGNDHKIYYIRTEELDRYIKESGKELKPTKYKTKSGLVSALGYTVHKDIFNAPIEHNLTIKQ